MAQPATIVDCRANKGGLMGNHADDIEFRTVDIYLDDVFAELEAKEARLRQYRADGSGLDSIIEDIRGAVICEDYALARCILRELCFAHRKRGRV